MAYPLHTPATYGMAAGPSEKVSRRWAFYPLLGEVQRLQLA